MVVMKFGGTSVGSAETIKNVYSLVHHFKEELPVVIVSAVGGVTDLLIEAGEKALKGEVDLTAINKKHNDIISAFNFPQDLVAKETAELEELLQQIVQLKELSPKHSAYLVSFGERISCQLVAAYFNQQGMKTKPCFSYELGLTTEDRFDGARPTEEAYPAINSSLKNRDYIPVITGFLGKNSQGEITTLGRGGSDYSASIIGNALDAKEIQIWTDVDGIMSTDPRVVPNAKNIPSISFKEASELAYFGAKILHPKTLVPAMNKNIPVVVKNTSNPDHIGTKILKECKSSGLRVISFVRDVQLVNIYSLRMLEAHGFLKKIFDIFEKHQVIVDMVSTSEVSVSVTVNTKQDLTLVEKELSEFSQVRVEDNRSIICVVGQDLRQDEQITGKVFSVLSDLGINVEMISQGASDINLSFVITNDQTDLVVKELHKAFFDD